MEAIVEFLFINFQKIYGTYGGGYIMRKHNISNYVARFLHHLRQIEKASDMVMNRDIISCYVESLYDSQIERLQTVVAVSKL